MRTFYEKIRGDAIYAAHFIANNSAHFSRPGAFEELFARVVQQAETGSLEVMDRVGDVKGAMSLVRQVATVLGYKVKQFNQVPGEKDKFAAPVEGIRSGYDTAYTHFKVNGKPKQ
jgi:hypothetical protein